MDYIKDVPIEVNRGSISGRSLLEGRAVHVADVTLVLEHRFAEAQRLGIIAQRWLCPCYEKRLRLECFL